MYIVVTRSLDAELRENTVETMGRRRPLGQEAPDAVREVMERGCECWSAVPTHRVCPA